MLKIAFIIGARPQFIKLAPLAGLGPPDYEELIIHTGQHYDETMSDIFFQDLSLPEPHYNLGIGSGTHGYQTGAMLQKIEEVLMKEKPQGVVVFGDTNSTLAGALAAAKLGLPIGHVEAGLRSYNRTMPEEINRVLTDHLSQILFCPSQQAVENLAKESITEGVFNVGDIMVDALLLAEKRLPGDRYLFDQFGIKAQEYILVTLHRPATVDHPERLLSVLKALISLSYPILFPVHPRTRKTLKQYGLEGWLAHPKLITLDPVSYSTMLVLEKYAKCIITDSGGVQKEAFLWQTPCITLREETEWVETVEKGGNVLVDIRAFNLEEVIRERIENFQDFSADGCYGNGTTRYKIKEILFKTWGQ